MEIDQSNSKDKLKKSEELNQELTKKLKSREQ